MLDLSDPDSVLVFKGEPTAEIFEMARGFGVSDF
jgi:hypothetical protein